MQKHLYVQLEGKTRSKRSVFEADSSEGENVMDELVFFAQCVNLGAANFEKGVGVGK